MTRDELYRLLGDVNAGKVDRALMEKDVWSKASGEYAILVSDMTGFTRLTREKGILYFLSAFRIFAQKIETFFKDSQCCYFECKADNFTATFRTVEEAVEVAKKIRALNYKDITCCVGIGYGCIIHLEDDIFGDQVNVAYKLGEDIAVGSEVLLSRQAAEKVTVQMEGPLLAKELEIEYFKLSPV
ncbi:MAG: hypothetical protein SGI71_09375 [Verrucomicrobiota bacterium]|nr:hypothetical protein [Verrucomicrobiota bacterium]